MSTDGLVTKVVRRSRAPTVARTIRTWIGGKTIARLLIYAVLGIYCITAVGSMIWVLATSFKTDTQFISTPPWSLPDPITLGNYERAWVSARIGEYFQNSVIVATISTAVSVFLGAMAAYALARIATRWNGVVLGFFLIGLMIPGIVMVIPVYYLFQSVGLLNTLHGLILIYVVHLLPFNIFILVGFFKTLPTEMEDAAAIDGASPWITFLRIMLPMATPGLAAVTVLAFLSTWNEFFFAMILNSDRSVYTLPMGLFVLNQQTTFGSSWTPVFAGLVITAIPVLAVWALLQNQVTKGLSAGAIKG